jgi:hypothetical protein
MHSDLYKQYELIYTPIVKAKVFELVAVPDTTTELLLLFFDTFQCPLFIHCGHIAISCHLAVATRDTAC